MANEYLLHGMMGKMNLIQDRLCQFGWMPTRVRM